VDGRLRAKNKDMFKLSVSPEDAPDKAEYVTLDFKQGNCVARQRQGAGPARRDADAQASWAASMAWAGWTWSRTATWA